MPRSYDDSLRQAELITDSIERYILAVLDAHENPAQLDKHRTVREHKNWLAHILAEEMRR